MKNVVRKPVGYGRDFHTLDESELAILPVCRHCGESIDDHFADSDPPYMCDPRYWYHSNLFMYSDISHGYFKGGDPRNFIPDETASPDEIALHEEAVALAEQNLPGSRDLPPACRFTVETIPYVYTKTDAAGNASRVQDPVHRIVVASYTTHTMFGIGTTIYQPEPVYYEPEYIVPDSPGQLYLDFMKECELEFKREREQQKLRESLRSATVASQ